MEVLQMPYPKGVGGNLGILWIFVTLFQELQVSEMPVGGGFHV
jgi:hypothetical protein